VNGLDQCEDGNAVDGDGCSAACTIEPGYYCRGTPSGCDVREWQCSNGVDDDANGYVDLDNLTCHLTADFAPCASGERFVVFAAVGPAYLGAAVPVPDAAPTGVTLSLQVPDAGTITRFAAAVSIAHTRASDLDLVLVPPGGGEIALSTGNGGDGDGYLDTLFDSGCTNPIASGAAPFTGCFAPEGSLAPLLGTAAKGTWKLRIVDGAAGEAGQVDRWRIGFCTAKLAAPVPATFADQAVALWLGADYTAGGDGTWGIDGVGTAVETLQAMGYRVPATTADGLYNNYVTVGGYDFTVYLTRTSGVSDTDLMNGQYDGLVKGDLLFVDYDFDYVWDHVGIYLGAYDGMTHAVLNASDYCDQVVVSDLDDYGDPFTVDLDWSNVSSRELFAEAIADL
jgi:cysteine-rich repeat protein